MSLTGMKYGFSANFHRERPFFVKPKANPLGFEPKFNIFLNP
jgi:hypothetical protein